MSILDSTDSAEEPAGSRGSFETTHWSIVLEAADDPGSVKARAALETLCRTYWQPLFVYVRQRGYQAPDAEDLVQGFFARILERRDLQAVRRERGRFRSYLLGGLKHYLINEWERAGARKRGGGQVPIPIDDLIQTQSEGLIAADHRSPDHLFDRQWALALLARVLARLREEYRAEARERQFDCLHGFLTGHAGMRPYAEIAVDLAISEGAVTQAVFRLRQRYQKLLRAEVAQTVATFGDVDAELRHLIAALRT